MNINHFKHIINEYDEDSIKRACFIVREYQRYEKNGSFVGCAVSKEEYEDALVILIDYSYKNSNNDSVALRWTCKSDCFESKGYNGFCPGEFQLYCYTPDYFKSNVMKALEFMENYINYEKCDINEKKYKEAIAIILAYSYQCCNEQESVDSSLKLCRYYSNK